MSYGWLIIRFVCSELHRTCDLPLSTHTQSENVDLLSNLNNIVSTCFHCALQFTYLAICLRRSCSVFKIKIRIVRIKWLKCNGKRQLFW